MHTYFEILSLLGFLAGSFLHAWVQASIKIGSKLNGLKGYSDYIDRYLPIVLFRFALSGAFLKLYAMNYVEIDKWIASKSNSLSWLGSHPIAAWPAACLIYGLLVDPLLSTAFAFIGKWVPWFNPQIPTIPTDDTQKP